MVIGTMKKRKAPVRGEKLDPRIVSWVLDKIKAVGINRAADELNECILNRCKASPSDVYARGQLKVLAANPTHRFQAYWHTYFGVWSGALGNVVEVPILDPMEMHANEPDSGVFEAQPEPATVETQPRPPSSEETGIVRTVKVDDWSIDFRLPSLTTEGAEQARVSLTELARFLGYQDKAQLKLLAGRHAQEIAQFGTTFTVKVVSGFGRVTEEPTYNQDQCIILGLASKTAVGAEIRVRMLKAYKALLATFEQVVREQPQTSVLERALTVMAQSQQALVANQNTTNMLLQSLISGRRQRPRLAVSASQQVIPQTVEQPKPEPAPEPKQTAPASAAPIEEPSPIQKLRASGLIACIPKPGKVDSRDVPDAIHKMVNTVASVTEWKHSDLFNSVYNGIQAEMDWDPRKKAANVKTALKNINSQSCERKLACYRVAYEVLIGQHLK